MWLFLTLPRVCLQFVIVLYPDHTHLLVLFKLPYFPANNSNSIAMHVLKFSFYKAGVSYNEIIPGTFGPHNMRATNMTKS